ncbi:hypothetical protein [Amycolatopsis anabasis]|uniref:hypothetical protein n=1 Tax=Amycolatopsis anabasis TaxID=1840409 RepID=UPI0015D293A9|nr:hypothetical protein [Amycolatopsis anabasis]
MASLFNKLARLANTPQGKKAIRQAKEFANDPRRKQQAKEALNKLRDRATGKGKPPAH